MKKDYLGNILNIGDTVVFMQINYRGLMRGSIISMTEQSALISHSKTNIGRTETRQRYDQMIKIEEDLK